MKRVYRERVKNRAQTVTAFTGHSIYKEYSTALPKRARLVADHLCRMKEVFGKLLSDENFLTLLRAEAITTIPAYLRPLVEGGKECP